jgi:NAD(P)H-flavin reductase/hemoglobin-like flavoprotein
MDTVALRTSWASVAAQGSRAAEVFYAVLFSIAPELRPMFPVAMAAQRDKLLVALGHIVSHVDDPNVVAGFLTQLGRDHRRFAVAEHHYPIVGRALLTTLQRTLGPAWTTELARDWSHAYELVSQLMIDGARHATSFEPAWWDADVASVERRTPNVTVLTVAPRHSYTFLPGQSIAVESELRPRVWRYLSPANAMRADYTIEFHVRAVPGGQVSPALAYGLRTGHTLKLGAPVGTGLARAHTATSDLLLIAGGTGLAPMRAIIEHRATARRSERVTLVVGANTASDLYDRERLLRLDQHLPWLEVLPALAVDRTWRGETGTAVQVALRRRDWTGHEIYVCGSPAMVDGTERALREAGYLADTIHAERFSNNTITAALATETAEESIRR